MYMLNDHFLIPWTANIGCSIALLFNPDGLEAKGMVSHAWYEDIEEFLEALMRELSGDEDAALWVCTFSQYQPKKDDNIADVGPSIGQQLALDPFTRVTQSEGVSKHTDSPYEIHGAMVKNVAIRAAVSSMYLSDLKETFAYFLKLADQDYTEAFEMFALRRLHVNTSQSECSRQDDKARITSQVEKDGGFKLLDKIIFNMRKRITKGIIDGDLLRSSQMATILPHTDVYLCDYCSGGGITHKQPSDIGKMVIPGSNMISTEEEPRQWVSASLSDVYSSIPSQVGIAHLFGHDPGPFAVSHIDCQPQLQPGFTEAVAVSTTLRLEGCDEYGNNMDFKARCLDMVPWGTLFGVVRDYYMVRISHHFVWYEKKTEYDIEIQTICQGSLQASQVAKAIQETIDAPTFLDSFNSTTTSFCASSCEGSTNCKGIAHIPMEQLRQICVDGLLTGTVHVHFEHVESPVEWQFEASNTFELGEIVQIRRSSGKLQYAVVVSTSSTPLLEGDAEDLSLWLDSMNLSSLKPSLSELTLKGLLDLVNHDVEEVKGKILPEIGVPLIARGTLIEKLQMAMLPRNDPYISGHKLLTPLQGLQRYLHDSGAEGMELKFNGVDPSLQIVGKIDLTFQGRSLLPWLFLGT